MRETVDVLVSGGGLAGLIAAAAFGARGSSVLCVDPAPPVIDESDPDADLRTTALLQPSVDLLERVGVWPRLVAHALPLQVMRIVDAAQGPARLTRDFDAAEVSDRPFGWNLPNWLIRRELVAHLATLPHVRFRPGVGTAGLVAREAEARVTLSDGTRLTARLVVAADGRHSPLRAALGIGVRVLRYGQAALAFAVAHDRPHEGVSTEIHRTGGPFTLVPLTDRDGGPRSAVVWLDRAEEIARLAALPVPDFEAAMTDRSAGVLGPLRLLTRRSVWPIQSQLADRFDGPRTALMAEAAHVVPPIGAQGLNMSLADLAALLDLMPEDRLGEAAALAAYTRRRWPQVAVRVAGVDLLNRASIQAARPLTDLRALALGALHGATPVRRGLMRLGMGSGGR